MSALLLADTKTHLNITSTTSDGELQAMIDAAEAILANSVGPLVVQSATKVRVAGGNQLVVPAAPIATLTAVASADGGVLDTSLLSVDNTAGIIYYTDNVTRFSAVAYDVTYAAGWTTVPPDLMLGIKEMVRHLWATQRGSQSRSAQPGQDPAPGYLMPYRVEQIIEPYRQINVGAA
jgi:uncharacterized phiE125 gp8 family phage protein